MEQGDEMNSNPDSPCPQAALQLSGCSLTDKALLREPLVSIALGKMSNTGGWKLLLEHQYFYFGLVDKFAYL